ncbi:MAG: hypothetical protein BroJett040_03720 [Oligoflexia bacterium]|nr:MAG: hypothetical protein BroJett040_03720 [Oligoflexia bacterium]
MNTEYWQPENLEKTNHALIFKKADSPQLQNEIESHLQSQNMPYTVLQSGKFTHEEYKHLLSKSLLMIYISSSETQGVAVFEAWSMNVPTLIWNKKTMDYFGKIYDQASTCPYLSPQVGLDFANAQEFKGRFEQFLKLLPTFNPRNFVLSKFSLSHSAQRMIDIIDDVQRPQKNKALEFYNID